MSKIGRRVADIWFSNAGPFDENRDFHEYKNKQTNKFQRNQKGSLQKLVEPVTYVELSICFICNIIFHSQFYSNVSSHTNKIRALFDFDVIMCGTEPVSHVHAHILKTRFMAPKRCALWLCLGTEMNSSSSSSSSIPGNLKTVMRFFLFMHQNKLCYTFE